MTDFNRWLGLTPGEDESTVFLDPRPEHLIAPDLVHFAVLTTLAEVAAGRAVGVPIVPATVTVHLLQPARATRLVGRGHVLRRGRRLATAEGEVLQDGKLVAKATITFALLSPG